MLTRVSAVGNVAVLLGMLVVVLYAVSFGEASLAALAPLGSLTGFVRAFGSSCFLFNIHFLALAIRQSMADPDRFLDAAREGFAFCAAVGLLFALVCAAWFGLDTRDIVLLNMSGSAFVATVKLLLVIDLLATYPLVLAPAVSLAADFVRPVMPRARASASVGHAVSSLGLGARERCVAGAMLVAATAAIAIVLPRFGGIASFVGGVCQSFLAFIAPALVHARVCCPGGAVDTTHGLVICLGVVMAVLTVNEASQGTL